MVASSTNTWTRTEKAACYSQGAAGPCRYTCWERTSCQKTGSPLRGSARDGELRSRDELGSRFASSGRHRAGKGGPRSRVVGDCQPRLPYSACSPTPSRAPNRGKAISAPVDGRRLVVVVHDAPSPPRRRRATYFPLATTNVPLLPKIKSISASHCPCSSALVALLLRFLA